MTFLNNEPCIVRFTLIDMNNNELKYYPFMISLNKCTGSCNVLSPNIYVPKETKNINVKALNMITNKDEAKAMTEHLSFKFKCKFNNRTCNSKQRWNNKTCQCECKNLHTREKDYSWNPGICIFENSKYSKSVADTSVTECDKIVIVIDNLSTKKEYNNSCNNSYNLYTVLLPNILLLIMTIICYHYAKQKDII